MYVLDRINKKIHIQENSIRTMCNLDIEWTMPFIKPSEDDPKMCNLCSYLKKLEAKKAERAERLKAIGYEEFNPVNGIQGVRWS